MEVARVRNQCACRCVSQKCAPEKKDYFYSYLENVKGTEKKLQTKPRSRPSSGGSIRSSSSSKRSIADSSKVASSDSRIMKKTVIKTKLNPSRNKEEHKSNVTADNIEQLRGDLQIIKEHLFTLAKNKDEALNITNELEIRYNHLVNKSKNQEKQIEELKFTNKKLLQELKNQKESDNINVQDVMTTKHCLDQYKEKLNCLYNEFLETSQIMEQSREKFCRCIKEKSNEFQKIEDSKKELSKLMNENDVKYYNLQVDYEKSKENESKYLEQNKKLTQTVEDLRNKLHQTTVDSEAYRQNAKETVKDLNRTNRKCTYETNSQRKDNGTTDQKNKRVCSCKKQLMEKDNHFEQLLHTHKHMLEKLNIYEENNKKWVEEVQMFQNNEKNLNGELMKLQSFVEELTNVTNEQNIIIARLNSSIQEKDSIIQCQKAQLASKDKQIELLSKNEDRLKRKVVQLQEDLVRLRIASNPEKINNSTEGMCTEDCSAYLTEELQDLISALYDEIDKTLAKDEQIQRQNRNICCLQCALSSKDKELLCIRNELKILRDQLTTTMKEKHALVDYLRKVESNRYVESEEETFRQAIL